MSPFTIMRLVLSALMLCVFLIMQFQRLRARKNSPDYDERQRLLRWKSYRDAFYIMMAALAGYAFLDILGKADGLERWLVSISILILGLGVYGVECIIREAGYRPSEDPYMAYWAGINLINFLNIAATATNEFVKLAKLRSIFFLILEIMALCLAWSLATGIVILRQEKAKKNGEVE